MGDLQSMFLQVGLWIVGVGLPTIAAFFFAAYCMKMFNAWVDRAIGYSFLSVSRVDRGVVLSFGTATGRTLGKVVDITSRYIEIELWNEEILQVPVQKFPDMNVHVVPIKGDQMKTKMIGEVMDEDSDLEFEEEES